MGKACKWIRALLGGKNPDPNPSPGPRPPGSKRWSFVMCRKERDRRRRSQHGGGGGYDGNDASRQAIAVAAATAAAAEAAVKAAQAAAAVVQLTSCRLGSSSTSAAGNGGGSVDSYSSAGGRNGPGYGWSREERAAVAIQSHFRAYLARRALRALKALVKIQAMVRGHISRKKAADDLRRMHAIVRVQARARAGRVPINEARHSTANSSHFSHSALSSWEKFEQRIRAGITKHEQPMMLKKNGSRSCERSERSWDEDERSDKILEVDSSFKPNPTPKIKNSRISHSRHPKLPISPSSSNEVRSLSRLKFEQDDAADDISSSSHALTSDNCPFVYSASPSSKTALFTPTKSEGSVSCLSGYSENPNYMAYTESSKAKARSTSAPKQRPDQQYERSSSTSRYSVHVSGDYGGGGGGEKRANKAYPGSGHLDKHGMPVTRDVSSFSGGLWVRY
ncbi:hypothetical protein ABFS82_05G099400 [Erythranthe guttata]|uniref:DUF4005 domain-containing protein n=1 Tax=Erythranthe guttata TaxID=4155 RepID=A0A022QPE3_ERYGU|nr:PREDICTED: uncharacterized protein LOC105966368 [Erythranthe guttata]EYU29831.1 hypothetical protein MIMGU_mgv1a006306mg [Erythranthe guttata]|eukprot:XP_012846380.1 PREDICTED: uncharacterized protein LOC105966368 [Erythranthe guttata]